MHQIVNSIIPDTFAAANAEQEEFARKARDVAMDATRAFEGEFKIGGDGERRGDGDDADRRRRDRSMDRGGDADRALFGGLGGSGGGDTVINIAAGAVVIQAPEGTGGPEMAQLAAEQLNEVLLRAAKRKGIRRTQ